MVSTEFKIRLILRGFGTAEEKADDICNFMTWNKIELIQVIRKYGTRDDEHRSYIIGNFWNENIRRKKI